MIEPERFTVGVPPTNATFRTLALDVLRERQSHVSAPTREALKAVVRFEKLHIDARTQAEWSTPGEINRLVRLDAGGFSIPAVEIRPASESKGCVTMLVADEGRATMAKRAAEFVARGCTVVALDLLLHGREGRTQEIAWYAQLLSTVGLRPLGIQASQLLAAAEYYTGRGGAPDVEAEGPRASLAALVAAAIAPDTMKVVTVHGLPTTLVNLLDEDVPYGRAPELFTFGLLPQFDVTLLKTLATSGSSSPVLTID
jgi:hypothetical protein